MKIERSRADDTGEFLSSASKILQLTVDTGQKRLFLKTIFEVVSTPTCEINHNVTKSEDNENQNVLLVTLH